MNVTALRKLAVVMLVLCIALCFSVACTPEQQLLLTAVDKIYSEVNGDDENSENSENSETADGSTVLAPEGDDSPAFNEVSD